MQATLEASSLKHITKALTCLSKFGDDLLLQATPERLLLHTTNSSSTAYCRFVYRSQFFTRFKVGSTSSGDDVEEVASADGQIPIKALLSILRPKTVEKSVHKCELNIVGGEPPGTGSTADEDHDSLESKLVIRLHCKYGVVKTHKLLLSDPSRHMAPNVPDSSEQSRLSIGPKAIREIIERFPLSKPQKSDPQLIWSFADDEVQVRSQESCLDTRNASHLATELTVGAEEFSTYYIHTSPIVIAFHMKEFNAAIAFAESCNLTLDLRFTDPADPLFMEAEGADLYETLFIISMSQVTGANTSCLGKPKPARAAQSRKRPLESDSTTWAGGSGGNRSNFNGSVAKKRPTKAAVPSDERSIREISSVRKTPARSMPPPTLSASAMRHFPGPQQSLQRAGAPLEERQPLFFPASQLSQADQELIRDSGLGIENMNMEEFNAMMDDEGEEVLHDDDQQEQVDIQMDVEVNVDDDEIEDTQMAPTQADSNSSDRTFRPLFDD